MPSNGYTGLVIILDPKKKMVIVLVVLWSNATLTAEVISWRSVTHMCFLAFSHQY